jgi:hypothetical protein
MFEAHLQQARVTFKSADCISAKEAARLLNSRKALCFMVYVDVLAADNTSEPKLHAYAHGEVKRGPLSDSRVEAILAPYA